MCIVLIAIVIFLATMLVTTTVDAILNQSYIRRIRLHHKKLSLTSIFSKSAGTNMADSHKYKVICAETRMCRMIAGLNLSLTAGEAITMSN